MTTLVTRRHFLRLCAGVISATNISGTAQGQINQSTIVSLKNYGAKGDGSSDDTSSFLEAIKNNLNGIIEIPPGRYLMTNPITIEAFNGHLRFDKEAIFVFRHADQHGLSLKSGVGAIIENYQATWLDKPPKRLKSGAAVGFLRTTNTKVINCSIRRSPSAGIIFYECSNPTVTNATVENTLSDGIHFANCENARVIDSSTINTGDDGIAFVNYADKPNYTGGMAQNVSVSLSKARGISVVGQSGVEIKEFSVQTTSSSGIYCAYEASFNTRVPSDVIFQDGVISEAGMNEPRAGNQYGIEIYKTGTVTIERVRSVGSWNIGLSVFAPDGEFFGNNIKIERPKNGSGAELKAKKIEIHGLGTENTPGTGVFISESTNVLISNLTVKNAAQQSTLNRAIWFENNAQVAANDVTVIDDQEKSSGFVIGGVGSLQKGKMERVKYYFKEVRSPVVSTEKISGIVVSPLDKLQKPATISTVPVIEE